jgi:YVTN family beta-propeller protein
MNGAAGMRWDGEGALPGDWVDGDGDEAALPGLKAAAHPARSSAVEGKGCGRHAPPALHTLHREGLALPLQGREPPTTAPARRRHTSYRAILALCALAVCLATGLAGCSEAVIAPRTSAALPVLPLPAPLAAYTIFVTDLSTGNVAELGKHTYHIGRSVHGLGLSSDGRTLYVTDISANRLAGYALHGAALEFTDGAPVGSQPVHMVNTRDGKTIFVTDFSGAAITVLDAATWAARGTIGVPAGPHGIVLSPDGRWAYVACSGGAAIAVLDTASATLAATIALPTGAQPYGIATSRDGRYIYASDNFTGRLFVIDTATRAVLPPIQVGLRPALIARSPDGATLYVANGGSHSVSVLDLAHDPAQPSLRKTVPVDGYPHGLAVTADGRYVVVANTIGQSLSVLDAASDRVIATIPAEKYPNDVLIVP